MFALVQGSGALLLAWLIWRARDSTTYAGSLTANMAELILLGFGGLLAVGLAVPGVKLTGWRWSVAGATISTAMLGRASDLIWNHTAFTGRVEIRYSLWLVMGISTLASWALIGAIADPGDREA